MAPLSGSDNDHTLAQPVPGVGVIHTITVDDTHMARTILTLQQLVVAVICPASSCGSYEPRALRRGLLFPTTGLGTTGAAFSDELMQCSKPMKIVI